MICFVQEGNWELYVLLREGIGNYLFCAYGGNFEVYVLLREGTGK
jgi:hypothetical protein